MNVPVVIVAYNRPDSLARLLGSLARARHPRKTRLIISVDGGAGNEETVRVACDFDWKPGEKEIIVREKNLGLKDHVLACAGMAADFGAVIILEDDLYVSPFYYEYAMKAVSFYRGDDRVAGISLYSHGFNETAGFPFVPYHDGSDVFFMQVPCSWGQCWTGEQWKKFSAWQEVHRGNDDPLFAALPPNVLRWPATSWKKIFMAYLADTGRFFAYPRVSLTTNFGDRGTHHRKNSIFQVPLLHGKKTFAFVKSKDSLAKYDPYCEMLPRILSALNPALARYDFAVDLYGMKPLAHLAADYALTSKKCKSPELSFGRDMLPLESGVIGNIRGDDISLARKRNCGEVGSFIRYRYRKNSDPELMAYHYSMLAVPGTANPLRKLFALIRRIK